MRLVFYIGEDRHFSLNIFFFQSTNDCDVTLVSFEWSCVSHQASINFKHNEWKSQLLSCWSQLKSILCRNKHQRRVQDIFTRATRYACMSISVFLALGIWFNEVHSFELPEKNRKNIKQAGAELSQAQPELGLWILLR